MNFNYFEKFLLFFGILLYVQCEQLVCYSKTKAESEAIYKYLYGSGKGFYVDVAPSSAILDSSTLFLRSQGWNGINFVKSTEVYSEF